MAITGDILDGALVTLLLTFAALSASSCTVLFITETFFSGAVVIFAVVRFPAAVDSEEWSSDDLEDTKEVREDLALLELRVRPAIVE